MGRFSVALCVCLLAACGEGLDPVTIDDQRDVAPHDRQLGRSSDQRFGGRQAFVMPDASSAPQASAFAFELPDGWSDLDANGMRSINLQTTGGASCYLSVTRVGGPDALPDNVNRWRGQFGAAPLDAAGIAALPQVTLLGEPAIEVAVTGPFGGGMGAEPIEDAALIGYVQIRGGDVITIKLIGQRSEVESMRDGLAVFITSIKEVAP
ncbi:MAG: hypothetical protein PF961_00495 [Planctomycetota bacterium]|jgi:hypothetical protein|nr:hypothetical protein [Planctomycetota bacterium]